MKTLDAPKNLTRNVLLGMTLGVIIASIFFYFQAQIPVDVFLARNTSTGICAWK